MIFEERQRFRQWWAWIAILAPAVVAWLLFFLQIVGGEPIGDNPAPDSFVWLMVAVMGIGFPAWFAVLSLETGVDEEGAVLVLAPGERTEWAVHYTFGE